MMATGTPARKTKLQGERSLWQTTSRPAAAAAGAASNAAVASWYRRVSRAAAASTASSCAAERSAGTSPSIQASTSRPVPPQGARGAVEARGLEVPEQAVDEVR